MKLAILLTAAAIAAFGTTAAVAETKTLGTVEAGVRTDYPDAAQLKPDDLEALRTAKADILLLDSREEAEFKVSHLPGARQVPPGMSAATFAESFGKELKGKVVVVYCSVGVRSSKFVERVGKSALELGAAKIYNLEGGIFRWHNERRPLESGSSSTDEVHPYSRSWQTYIQRPESAAYEPGASKARAVP